MSSSNVSTWFLLAACLYCNAVAVDMCSDPDRSLSVDETTECIMDSMRDEIDGLKGKVLEEEMNVVKCLSEKNALDHKFSMLFAAQQDRSIEEVSFMNTALDAHSALKRKYEALQKDHAKLQHEVRFLMGLIHHREAEGRTADTSTLPEVSPPAPIVERSPPAPIVVTAEETTGPFTGNYTTPQFM